MGIFGEIWRIRDVRGGMLLGFLEVLGGPLERSGRVPSGPLGAHRDVLPVGMRFLTSLGDPNRQPSGNPSL